ncbi:hypothetical protein C7S17_4124 [Burkholderia thailandensis]|nr:hypothetical protein [Burkholderia thailandensis]
MFQTFADIGPSETFLVEKIARGGKCIFSGVTEFSAAIYLFDEE